MGTHINAYPSSERNRYTLVGNENKIEPALNKLLLKIIKTKGIILFYFIVNDVLSLGIAHTLLGSY
jgi:hypothetical protein